LPIFFLFIVQLYNTKKNLTTLETFIEGIDDQVINIHKQNPFDKNNAKVNFKEIFGEGCWLLPTAPIFDDENSLIHPNLNDYLLK